MNNDETTTFDAGDALLEIQAAIDRLTELAFEEWPEDGDPAPEDEDVCQALLDLRPLVTELDALWLHLRQSVGR